MNILLYKKVKHTNVPKIHNGKKSTHLAFHWKYCVIEIDIQFSHKTANGRKKRTAHKKLEYSQSSDRKYSYNLHADGLGI